MRILKVHLHGYKKNVISIAYMTIKEAEKAIIAAGGSVEVFWKFMGGQTMGMYADGSTDVYDWDVARFIRYECDPKKEPMVDVD
jgi:hypothetical protein